MESGQSKTARTPSTSLSQTAMTDNSLAPDVARVIIVGAGYAGLGCAIECKHKGHDVIVLEKVGTFKMLGEMHSSRLWRSSSR